MPDWLNRMGELLLGGPEASAGAMLLRGSLLGCSLLASIQMLTMWGTRWGDQHAMLKSFFLSVVVHLCLGLGWATVLQSAPAVSEPPGQAASIPIRQVTDPSDEPLSHTDDGVSALFQQPVTPPAPEVARTDRQAPTLPDDPAPTLQNAPNIVQPPLDVPTLAMANPQVETLPEPTKVAPTNQPVANLAAPQQAVPQETLPQPESRSEAGVSSGSPSRQAMVRAPTPDALPEASPARGAARRSAVSPDDAALALALPTEANSPLPKPIGPDSNAISRKASPAAAPADSVAAGAPDGVSGPNPPRSASGQPGGFSRSGSRSGTMADLPQVASATPRRDPGDSGPLAGLSSTVPGEGDPVPQAIAGSSKAITIGPRSPGAASTYRLRRLERRQDIALRNGGTVASEKAVEAALEWLASVQSRDGSWDADKHGGGAKEVRQIEQGKPPGGLEADTGVTGLAILAFLGAGYTHEEGEHAETVRRALEWLIRQQRNDGYLGGRATYYDQSYCHAIATYALAEASGMQKDQSQFRDLREAVARAVWYITQTQNTDGGWRYRVGASASDMSIFGWMLMALKSAELAGIEVPVETRNGMIRFLKDRSRGKDGGLAGYKDDSPPTPAMTAEALFCKQIYGLRRTNPASLEATRTLEQSLPKLSQPDEYYWYYGTLAMFQHGGESWEKWNPALRDTLVRLQRGKGELSGSWDPAGPYGSVGGRIYSTALSAMCLEVYYRFLPLYQVSPNE